MIMAVSLPSLSAQTTVNFGTITVDPTSAVEVASDSLTVDQATGLAVFTGNVIIGQGEMRMNAPRVEVIYDDLSGNIARLRASGGVTFVTATEAAEADNADYSLTDSTITLTGDVLLTQEQSAISSDKMIINTLDGTAVMEGRVRSVLQQGDN